MPELIKPNFFIGRTKQDRAKEWTPAKGCYLCLMEFNLLSFLWIWTTGTSLTSFHWFLRVVTALLALYLGRLWKNKGFRILAAYAGLFFFRVYICSTGSVFSVEMADSLFSALWLFAGCFGLGTVLKQRTKTFLWWNAIVWIIGVTVLSAGGIISAWNGNGISLFNSAKIHTEDSRLNIVYLATTTGSILGTTSVITSIILLCSHRKDRILFFAFAQFVIMVALALTDSRTGYISSSAGMSITGAIAFDHYVLEERHIGWSMQKTRIKRCIFALVIGIVIFALLIGALFTITPVFNHLKASGLVPSAYAEGNKESIMSARGLELSQLFSGRDKLWAEVMQYISDNPLVLLTGKSKITPLNNVTKQYWVGYGHCHSIYVQVLLESGIPGLVLLLCFVFYTLRNSLALIKDTRNPLWLRLLPSIPICLWIGDIVECFTWLRASQCPMTAMLLICAGIINTVKIADDATAA